MKACVEFHGIAVAPRPTHDAVNMNPSFPSWLPSYSILRGRVSYEVWHPMFNVPERSSKAEPPLIFGACEYILSLYAIYFIDMIFSFRSCDQCHLSRILDALQICKSVGHEHLPVAYLYR